MSFTKKTFATLLAIIILAGVMSLSGCNRDSGTDGENPDVTQNEPPEIPFDPEDEDFEHPFSITGVPGEGMTLEPSGINERGNTAGNINNWGTATMQGDWIFYAVPSGIFRMRQDSSDTLQISNMMAFGLNAIGDWLYFVSDWKIYRMLNNGTELELIFEPEEGAVATYLHVFGDRIFFSLGGSGNGNLFRMNTDGTELRQLNQVESLYPNVIDDWIYFSNADSDWRIYRMRHDGTQMSRVSSNDSEFLNVAGDWIFYAYDSYDETMEMHIFRVHRNRADEKIRVNGDTSTELNVAGNWIFYINNDSLGRIYRIDINGDNRARLNNHSSASLSVVGDWIFYAAEIGGDDVPLAMYKMRLDGTESTRIS
ncbi:MAG: DUF5050 domain-containing protein [Oscillospiraceae bacterium]|nr:DUF5050 domain-containing protein [Oscillospiraceae bacterium]